jgi:hypothetical protein
MLRRLSTHRRSFFYAEKKLGMSTLCAHFRVLPGVKTLYLHTEDDFSSQRRSLKRAPSVLISGVFQVSKRFILTLKTLFLHRGEA